MREIKASEFKAKCLRLLDEVAETGEPIVVTKNGKPVARVVREGAASPKSLRGCMKGRIEILSADGELPSAWTDEDNDRWEAKLARIADGLSAPRPRKQPRKRA